MPGRARHWYQECRQFDWRQLLEVETFGLWPASVRALVLGASAMLVFSTGYYFWLAPGGRQLAALEKQHASMQAALVESETAVGVLKQERAQVAALEEEILKQRVELPAREEMPDLLETITASAARYGVELESMKLAPALEEAPFRVQPIQLKTRGDFQALGRFVAGLAGLSRLVTVHTLSLEQQDSARGLKGIFEVRTFLREQAVRGFLPVRRPREDAVSVFHDTKRRSPFMHEDPRHRGLAELVSPGPVPARLPHPLEDYALEELRLVGSIAFGSERWALVRTPPGKLERVTVGNYMGRNNGRVTSVGREVLRLEEYLPSELPGHWRRRSRQLRLLEELPAGMSSAPGGSR